MSEYLLPTLPVMDHALPPVGVDFEAYYDAEVTIQKLGVWGYLHHPQCDIYLVAIDDGAQSFVGHPADFDWTSLEGRLLVSHNRTFDFSVYLRLLELGLVDQVRFAEWACTADLACFLKGGRALKRAAKTLLGQSLSKDVRKLMKGLTPAAMAELMQMVKGRSTKLVPYVAGSAQTNGSTPQDAPVPTFYDDVREYALCDTRTCRQLWVDYADQWPEFERRLSLMTGRSCTKGFSIDRPNLEQDVIVLRAAMDAARAKMPWAQDLPTDEGVQSIPAMVEAIKAIGLEPPSTTAEDSLELQAWETANPTCTWTRDMRDFRKAGILISRCQTLLDCSDPATDRFSFALRYYGAEKTGRWAGGSSERVGGWNEKAFNVHNFPKEPLLGVDLRNRIVAAPGKKLIIADAAQIEPRCTAWLTGDEHKLELMRAGVSVYQIHAIETMGHDPLLELKTFDKNRYALAKVRVLGLGYQCGHVKFRDFAASQYKFFMTLPEAKRNVSDFRRKERLIVTAWKKLQAEFCMSAGGDYEIELPSGRILTYYDVHMHGHEWIARRTLDGKFNKYYGGKLFENLVQAMARDVFGYMLQAVEDKYGDVNLFHVHDEGIFEVDEDVDLKEFEATMSVCPPWCEGLPVAVEAAESYFYCK